MLKALGLVAAVTSCASAVAGGLAARQDAAPVSWAAVLQQRPAWYSTPAARAVADSILTYQRADGGWPKNVDMTAPDRAGARSDHASTIDNGATTTQIAVLARVFAGSHDARYRQGAMRGLEYLLAAQYPNGGWPQVYPLERGYSRHITFNDDAMVRVMELLDEVANGREPFGFAPSPLRERAARAVAAGIGIILKTQVRVGGVLTAWCAQHDENTLEPRDARTYEHASLSGRETVGIVRLLMHRAAPEPAIVAAIEAATAWLRSVRLDGWRLERRADPSKPNGWDRAMVRDADAPPLWARFYEIGTNRPIFSGRDGIIRYRLEEIEHERRTGYAWLGDWPRALLDTEYPAWKARLR